MKNCGMVLIRSEKSYRDSGAVCLINEVWTLHVTGLRSQSGWELSGDMFAEQSEQKMEEIFLKNKLSCLLFLGPHPWSNMKLPPFRSMESRVKACLRVLNSSMCKCRFLTYRPTSIKKTLSKNRYQKPFLTYCCSYKLIFTQYYVNVIAKQFTMHGTTLEELGAGDTGCNSACSCACSTHKLHPDFSPV